ncbi:MAG: thiamine phosphate synthase [Planctomycetota bacterium]|nr:thiamine phosphate synthase [Planctomycetota bacterium]
MEKTIFRIIDANSNRSREALRVVEEFCRFGLNSYSLSARAKKMRHLLCETISKLDQGRLLTCRDSEGDVGRQLRIEGQMTRRDLRDCLTAAMKRLTEALRALAETTQMFDVGVSGVFENLRFQAYTLEKDIAVLINVADKFDAVRLYVLVGAEPQKPDSQVLDIVRECSAGGADCIQLRAKGLNDNRLVKLATEFVSLCRRKNIISVINDRVDIAALAGADGVHLGQDDLPVVSARQIPAFCMFFGKSTHSPDELAAAITEKTDYVGIGPVFVSTVKPGIPTAGLEYVRKATEILADTDIRHVAIGGINIDNVDHVLSAGARAVAVSSAVTNSSEPAAECRKLKEKILSFDS